MIVGVKHLTLKELETGLDKLRQSPKDQGLLEAIVRRPNNGQREVLQEGQLDVEEGLVGDNWRTRGSSLTPDGSPHPDMQINIMNSRVIALMAQDKSHWQLSGDQLFIDIDLSVANVTPAMQLALGSAVMEVTDKPHTNCKTFAARFGLDATSFVNSSVGKELRLRGINAKVVRSGHIRVGDIVKKLCTPW
jgi:hypothetical protein